MWCCESEGTAAAFLATFREHRSFHHQWLLDTLLPIRGTAVFAKCRAKKLKMWPGFADQ